MHARLLSWALSYLITILFLAIAAYHLAIVHQTFTHEQGQITDTQTLEAYLSNYWQTNGIPQDQIPLYIPTGMYVDTLKWVDAETFLITGYIWQKFNEKTRQVARPGFTLPDAVEMEIEEAYRFNVGADEVVGWHFGGKLNQSFDYSKFPLDEETVKIRIWHGDFNRKVHIVPDFSSYDSTGVQEIFGLSPEVKLSGYQVLDTFFMYQRLHYDTNLGIPTFSRKVFPELTYNIELKRDVIDILVMHLFPLIVVIFLSFLTLLSYTFDEQKREIFSFHYLDVLTASAALFFVVILAHSYLRETMSWSGFVYFEYLYVITYAAVVYMTINSFFMAHTDLACYRFYKLFTYEDNLIPKVLFLPLVACSFMCLALAFY